MRHPELNAFCRQLKLTASDGKEYLCDCIGQAGIDAMALSLPGKYRAEFVDWRRIDKKEYLGAMERSVVDVRPIRDLISGALTDAIDG